MLVGGMIPIVPLPPLELVDDNDLKKDQTGIYGVLFDPQDVTQVVMTLHSHYSITSSTIGVNHKKS